MSNDTSSRVEIDAAASAVSAGGSKPLITSVPSGGGSSADPGYRPNANPNPSHQQQHQPPPPPPHPHPPHPPHASIYHAYPPPPPSGHFGAGGPYSAAMGKPGTSVASQYHPRHPLPPSRPQPPPGQGQPPQSALVAGSHLSSPRRSYDREDQHFHRPIPLRVHPNDADYRGHPPPPPPPPPTGSYPATHYGSNPEERRWMGPETAVGHPGHPYPGYDYSKPHPSQSFPPPPPPPVAPGHLQYRYPHPVYPGSRLEDKPHVRGHQSSNSAETYNEVDGREGATSPSQIELSHRDEVTNMGCTCKKTKCLKLYCQCFAVKIYCGQNCRCLLCFNTTKHEQARKDAMRSILTRNPTAFDTKFSKTKERKTKEQQLILAHKLGCKCRKSACMKKYCECYAGNVKCSPNCRCIGCKNTTSSNFGPGKPDANIPIAMREGGMVGYDLPMPPPHGARTGREPWMMNAAQNLAFLKHGSPTVEKSTAKLTPHEAGEVASMPSLAASSSDTSPEEKTEVAPNRATDNEGEAKESTVNSLLLAAMAMTEFQSQPRNVANDSSNKDGSDDDKAETSLEGDRPEVRKVFRPSPKRKSSYRAEDDALDSASVVTGSRDESTVDSNSNTQSTGLGTKLGGSEPLDPRDLKRTRKGEAAGSPDSATVMRESAPHLETPNQKTSGADILTPISARCIDFKKIHLSSSSPLSSVNEKKNG